MKQEIITYLSTLKEELFQLSYFLYTNPEKSFEEYKAKDYITNLLKKYNFNITHNYMNIPTAFYAEYGTGHPKICYICKFSASSFENTHIYGNNMNCSMSVGAALGLSKIISKTKGTVILLGCPGDDFNGSELTMAKQGIFEDIDVVIAPHSDVKNFESGTSMTVMPMQIEYLSNDSIEKNTLNYYSPLDACLFTFNALGILLKNTCNECSIDGISIEGAKNPYIYPSYAKAKFYIRTQNDEYAEILEDKIRNFIKALSPILNVKSNISFFELPSQSLLTNKALSRLFEHNLKESGIINIDCCKDYKVGLSIGSISHTTPCIYPSIGIVNDTTVIFPSKEFAECTVSEFGKEILLKACQALALTGLDIIEKEELLREMTEELYKNT
ncbi:p-aminobenzoyl-glutamate hydrolase subunit B [Clostridium tepidiprofundi DSM 19306]|uniref:Peptidase M20 domain-containing protein 2 n=1 Tax=Clostridium tepidiprofundi DSM 19306 TaxID=1121338 RepID=A0A151AW71_9CLOT|nr:hypothetical protein [Clostridium tepidiprofundi]KYH31896.1 p-aminobenzoyl-glutamate hydrolase subunit B [Clostridium tepidiprofundi DSM 19306]